MPGTTKNNKLKLSITTKKIIMKKQTLFLIAIISMFIVSCSTAMSADQNKLYNTGWELEYITGPRITFEGLYPDTKPTIRFTPGSMMITGNSGCNVYNPTFTMEGKMVSFKQPETSTMAFCGDGEVVFRTAMQKVDNYKIESDGKLAFLMGDIVVMRFKPAM